MQGKKEGDKTFKNHLDGYNFLPYFKGQVTEASRQEFFYFSDNGDLMALRYDAWKISFKRPSREIFYRYGRDHQCSYCYQSRQDP